MSKNTIAATATAIATACAMRERQQIEGLDNRQILAATGLAELRRNLAFFQTEAFAKIAYADKINVGFIDGSNGAIWLDLYGTTRLIGFMKMIAAGVADVTRPKDMQRFSVRAMNTSRAHIAKGEGRFSRVDMAALVSKGQNKETASGYADGALSDGVQYATEYYSDAYAKRQGIMTLRAFESLGMVARIQEGTSATRDVKFQPINSAYFKRANEVYTAHAMKMAATA